MKKILIALFSLCLIFTVSNVNACETCGCQDNTETVKKECSSSKADANSGAKNAASQKRINHVREKMVNILVVQHQDSALLVVIGLKKLKNVEVI